MKFKVTYFSPDLENAVKGWGETSMEIFASNSNQALHFFRDMYPDWDYLVRGIEEMPLYHYSDNVGLRGSGKADNYSMDPSKSEFTEYFVFEGVVFQAEPVGNYNGRVAQTMLIWNGKFDNKA